MSTNKKERGGSTSQQKVKADKCGNSSDGMALDGGGYPAKSGLLVYVPAPVDS